MPAAKPRRPAARQRKPVASSLRDQVIWMRRAAASASFGQVTVSTPSRRSAVMRVGVDRHRQLECAAERAVAALDAMILFAGAGHARGARRRGSAGRRETGSSMSSRAMPGSSAVTTYSVGGFVQIDRRLPAGGTGRKPIQPLLDGQQIANRIPARKRHEAMLAHRNGTPTPAAIPPMLQGAAPVPAEWPRIRMRVECYDRQVLLSSIWRQYKRRV